MSFTVFSFVTSCAFSTLTLLAVHILRKNPNFIKRFGVKAILLGYTVCLLRMLFTPEFLFTKKWELPHLANMFFKVFYLQPVKVISSETSFFVIFLFVWWIVAFLLLFCFSMQYIVGLKRIKKYRTNICPNAQEILSQIQTEYDRTIDVKVFVCPETDTPLGIGLLSKFILLPNSSYPSQELYHIIKHEYTHFYNRDLTVKFLVMLFCCVFWWNPTVYLLWWDMSQILEIKCDLTITQHYSNLEKKTYLSVIISLLRDGEKNSKMKFPASMGFIKRKCDRALVERFDVVLTAPKRSNNRELLLTFCVYITLFLFSYAVVIQPKYDPPVGENISEDGSVCPTLEGYVLRTKNGDYYLCRPGKEPMAIKRETAEVFISTGIEFKEIEKQ